MSFKSSRVGTSMPRKLSTRKSSALSGRSMSIQTISEGSEAGGFTALITTASPLSR